MEKEKYPKSEIPATYFSKLPRDGQIRLHHDYLDATQNILEKIKYYDDYIAEFAKMKDIQATQAEKHNESPLDASNLKKLNMLESQIDKIGPKIESMKEDITKVIEEYEICEDTINTLAVYILETQNKTTEKILTKKVTLIDKSKYIGELKKKHTFEDPSNQDD